MVIGKETLSWGGNKKKETKKVRHRCRDTNEETQRDCNRKERHFLHKGWQRRGRDIKRETTRE